MSKERKITICTALDPPTISCLEEMAKQADQSLCAYIRRVLIRHVERTTSTSTAEPVQDSPVPISVEEFDVRTLPSLKIS